MPEPTNRNISLLPEDERNAAHLLTAILEAKRPEPVDIDGAQGMHDFDLVMWDGSRIAVEVTTDTSENQQEFMSVLDSKSPFRDERLCCYWTVAFRVPANGDRDPPLKDVIPELVEILIESEQTGLLKGSDSLPLYTSVDDEHPLIGRLRSMGVASASVNKCIDEGAVSIMKAPEWSPLNANDVVRILPLHIERKREKLMRARENGASEAHLFVWLPVGVGRSFAAFAAASLPLVSDRITAAVDLLGLDSVWVTTDGVPVDPGELGHVAPVHRYDGSKWSVHQMPSLHAG